MKKAELARRLAKREGLSNAEAADELDRAVHEILTALRKGEPASLPGLGKFLPGAKWKFRFDGPAKGGRGRGCK
jgi:nucleoid DNA-binding protein